MIPCCLCSAIPALSPSRPTDRPGDALGRCQAVYLSTYLEQKYVFDSEKEKQRRQDGGQD